jgi:hypothetical protein
MVIFNRRAELGLYDLGAFSPKIAKWLERPTGFALVVTSAAQEQSVLTNETFQAVNEVHEALMTAMAS